MYIFKKVKSVVILLLLLVWLFTFSLIYLFISVINTSICLWVGFIHTCFTYNTMYVLNNYKRLFDYLVNYTKYCGSFYFLTTATFSKQLLFRKSYFFRRCYFLEQLTFDSWPYFTVTLFNIWYEFLDPKMLVGARISAPTRTFFL